MKRRFDTAAGAPVSHSEPDAWLADVKRVRERPVEDVLRELRHFLPPTPPPYSCAPAGCGSVPWPALPPSTAPAPSSSSTSSSTAGTGWQASRGTGTGPDPRRRSCLKRQRDRSHASPDPGVVEGVPALPPPAFGWPAAAAGIEDDEQDVGASCGPSDGDGGVDKRRCAGDVEDLSGMNQLLGVLHRERRARALLRAGASKYSSGFSGRLYTASTSGGDAERGAGGEHSQDAEDDEDWDL